MKRSLLLSMLIFCTVLLFSCVRQFKTGDYKNHAIDHQSIAVLPFEIILTGKKYNKLSKWEIDSLILNDSELFYTDLYDQLLKKTGNRNNQAVISIQPIHSTRSRLQKANINALNINDYSATELNEILDVDAVLRTRLYTQKFLSRTEAFVVSNAIDIAQASLNIPGLKLPNKTIAKSSEIKLIASIDDTESDVVVWRYDNEYEQDWTDEIDNDVHAINRNLAKYFPYRKR